jgi:hypothetical protein
MNYLTETYGGAIEPYEKTHGYCCYTIYDREYDMYYSGMKSYQGSQHPVGTSYFTSSTVVDFRARFKAVPSQFDIHIEYFPSLTDAALAEREFHTKFKVGQNDKFYNVQISGGSHCGAGTVLCAAGDGTYYRVSKQEYAKGGHRHTVKGTFLVRILDDNSLKRVSAAEFNEHTMKAQFDDHVLCYDNVYKRNRRIPRSEFLNNPDRYVGITKGKCTVYDKVTHEKVTIDAGSMDHDRYYTNAKAKTVKVRTKDGQVTNVCRDTYDKKSSEYAHVNSGFLVRLNLTTMSLQRVCRSEYDQNPNIYADLRAKYYYETPQGVFGSWRKLTNYYGVSQWLSVTKIEAALDIKIHKKEILHED